MRAFDLSPLLRSSIGFDPFGRLLEAAQADEDGRGYPPYDIEKQGEDSYQVSLAVAGFTLEDLDLTVRDNTLIVSGRIKGEGEPADGSVKYLHRGIARRAFERRFGLADTIKVTGASLENGLLHVNLVRVVPEALKPRQIPITAGPNAAPAPVERAA